MKNKLNIESRVYMLNGLSPILGSAPASRDIRTRFIASKVPTKELREAEEAETFDLDDKGLTVFNRNPQDQLCLKGHQIKGFFKSALSAIKAQAKIAQPGAKVDNLVFVEPTYIPLCRDDEKIYEEDEILERPLRARTMQGERVTLAASEMINDPWSVVFEVSMIPSDATKRSEALTWDKLELALDYGAYHGLVQWRNAGYGRFTWRRLDGGDDE